jgi:hypothetical protein
VEEESCTTMLVARRIKGGITNSFLEYLLAGMIGGTLGGGHQNGSG